MQHGDKRLAYQGKIEAQLIEWGSEIDRWEDQTGQDNQKLIDDLNHRRQAVRSLLSKMQTANDSQWREFQTEMERAVEAMKRTVEKTRTALHS